MKRIEFYIFIKNNETNRKYTLNITTKREYKDAKETIGPKNFYGFVWMTNKEKQMSNISGSNHQYLPSQITNAPGSTITRNGFTEASTDTFPDTIDIVNAEFGTGVLNNSGQSFTITITNSNASIYSITQQMGIGMTLQPSSSFTSNTDIILYGESKTYVFIVISNTTADVFLQSTASGSAITGIQLADAHLLVGDADGLAQGLVMSGEGTMSNSANFTLGPDIAGATNFSNETNSSSDITGSVTVAGGLGVSKDVFVAGQLSVPSVTGLAAPITGSDAVNKSYVDNLINGLSWKEYVLVASNISITLTGTPVIDGITTSAGDRVLLTAQEPLISPSSAVDNGIWVVGTPFTRPSDFADGSMAASASVLVAEGNVFADTAFVCTDSPLNSVIGNDPLTIIQWSSGTVGITSINLLQGPNITLAAGTGGSDFNVVSAGDTVTYNIPDAGPAARGVVTTGSQAFNGAKTFSDPISIEASSGGTVTLSAGTGIVTPYTMIFPPAQGLAGQVQELDATGNMQWISRGALSFWYGYGPTTLLTLTDIATVVQVVEKVEEIESYNATGGTITIPSTGSYKIAYWVQFATLNRTGGTRSSAAGQLFVNSVVRTGTTASCYLREQTNDSIRPGAGKTVILNLSNGDVLDLRALRVSGTTTGSIMVNESTLTVERLK